MRGVAREAWEGAGDQGQGAALSGIAAEGLEQGSGIGSRTLASLEHQWANDRERLTDKHIFVIDEAGMIGTRQLERVVSEAEKQGAKVVLVGDPEQLQAIEAGAAFRAAAERSEEHTAELQSLMGISFAGFCVKKNKKSESCTPSYTAQLSYQHLY